ncbi:hypothetical protein GCM10010302_04410 [Streptomyces polychromogenes]|uniref:Uncharacterized protein n=1 Tax=Streptomyces polychromogenes TaxID=67342 RepID=A0ABN0V121_9ACTN
MTAHAWSGGRLIAAAAVLAAAGLALLYAGAHGIRPGTDAAVPRVTGPARPSGPAAPSAAASVAPPSPRASAGSASSAAPVVPGPTGPSAGPGARDGGAVARELPPPGSGPTADPIIQQALDQASPPDLPPDDERQLLELGRQAWTAETAGYTQVRVQAATARRDTPAPAGGERTQAEAVVRLVWAGANPAGTFLDGRTATLHYTQNGQGSWNRT